MRSPIPLLCLALASCALSCGEERVEGPRPPVVLIVIDTLSAGHVSHLGYDRETTPNLDALAAEGITFNEAIAPASYTIASIPSILTGRLPDNHGVIERGRVLDESEVTLAEVLKEEGYKTYGAVGNVNGGPAFGNQQGFDEFVEVYLGEGPPGRRIFEVGGRKVHLALADEFLPLMDRWLDGTPEDPRKLLYLHVFEPHTPYDPPGEFFDLFLDERYPGPPRPDERKRIHIGLDRAEAQGVLPKESVQQGSIRLYDAYLNWADHCVGQMLQKLKDRDLYDEALIIVTSDHGEAFWQHGINGHNQQIYDEIMRVPMIVKLPKAMQLGGKRIESMVSTIDVVPSVCEWMNLSPPDVDGLSVAPLVDGREQGDKRDALFIRSYEDTNLIGLRLPGAKVIVHEKKDGRLDLDNAELYLLDDDVAERDNLAKSRSELASEMLAELEERWFNMERRAKKSDKKFNEAQAELLKHTGYVGSDE